MFFKKTIQLFLLFKICCLQSSDDWKTKIISSCATELRSVVVNGKSEKIWLRQFVVTDDFSERELSDIEQSLSKESSLFPKYVLLFKNNDSGVSLIHDRVAYEQHCRDAILQKSIVVGRGVHSVNQNQGAALAIKQAVYQDVEKTLRQL